MDSAVVGGVLALGQAAVLLHTGFGNKLGVLISDAVASFVVSFGIVSGPPIAQISVFVEFAPLIVIAMDGLVPNHGASGRVVDRIVFGGIEERRLQNSGREVDCVGLRILVCVHRRRGHSPLGSVQPLANFLQLAVEFECRSSLHVGQMIVRLEFPEQNNRASGRDIRSCQSARPALSGLVSWFVDSSSPWNRFPGRARL